MDPSAKIPFSGILTIKAVFPGHQLRRRGSILPRRVSQISRWVPAWSGPARSCLSLPPSAPCFGTYSSLAQTLARYTKAFRRFTRRAELDDATSAANVGAAGIAPTISAAFAARHSRHPSTTASAAEALHRGLTVGCDYSLPRSGYRHSRQADFARSFEQSCPLLFPRHHRCLPA